MTNNKSYVVGIHPVHRRMAELFEKVSVGGYAGLSVKDQQDLHHCMVVNSKLVRKLDELKNLAFVAHCSGDLEWEQDIQRQIETIEVTLST